MMKIADNKNLRAGNNAQYVHNQAVQIWDDARKCWESGHRYLSDSGHNALIEQNGEIVTAQMHRIRANQVVNPGADVIEKKVSVPDPPNVIGDPSASSLPNAVGAVSNGNTRSVDLSFPRSIPSYLSTSKLPMSSVTSVTPQPMIAQKPADSSIRNAQSRRNDRNEASSSSKSSDCASRLDDASRNANTSRNVGAGRNESSSSSPNDRAVPKPSPVTRPIRTLGGVLLCKRYHLRSDASHYTGMLTMQEDDLFWPISRGSGILPIIPFPDWGIEFAFVSDSVESADTRRC